MCEHMCKHVAGVTSTVDWAVSSPAQLAGEPEAWGLGPCLKDTAAQGGVTRGRLSLGTCSGRRHRVQRLNHHRRPRCQLWWPGWQQTPDPAVLDWPLGCWTSGGSWGQREGGSQSVTAGQLPCPPATLGSFPLSSLLSGFLEFLPRSLRCGWQSCVNTDLTTAPVN